MAEVVRETPADGVALLRISRPEVLNPLSPSVRKLPTGASLELERKPAFKGR